jgi:hypothetical protein
MPSLYRILAIITTSLSRNLCSLCPTVGNSHTPTTAAGETAPACDSGNCSLRGGRGWHGRTPSRRLGVCGSSVATASQPPTLSRFSSPSACPASYAERTVYRQHTHVCRAVHAFRPLAIGNDALAVAVRVTVLLASLHVHLPSLTHEITLSFISDNTNVGAEKVIHRTFLQSVDNLWTAVRCAFPRRGRAGSVSK